MKVKRVHIRLLRFWERIRDSYWFIPSLLLGTGLALGFGLVALDQRTGDGTGLRWIYQGGPEGARAVLATIGGSVVGTAGVVFSITIAVLSLASGQFGPRLLRSFMTDRGSQFVLGTFLGTFIYCLIVLRTVRGGEENAYFVPALSVTVGVVLGVLSVGVLVYFIHHVAVLIQAPQVIAAVSRELHERIASDFPLPEAAGDGEGAEEEAAEEEAAAARAAPLPEDFAESAVAIGSRRRGYVQALDLVALIKAAREHDALLYLTRRPGAFVARGGPLAMVWPGGRVSEALATRVNDAFVVGPHRTQTQDMEFAIDQLVEVAVRALSPGINDPFTANTCVDYLGSALREVAAGRPPPHRHVDDDGALRVVIAYPRTFAGVLDAAFHQIRQHAAGDAAVLIHLLEAFSMVIGGVRCARDLAPLLEHAAMVRALALASLDEPRDRADVEARHQRVLRAVDARRRLLEDGVGASTHALLSR